MDGVPAVGAVFRYPVKSMLGTRVEQAEVRVSGLAGDRGWALVDRQTGKVASAKQPRLWRSLLQLRTEYHADADGAEPAGAVTITLPDGTSVRADEPYTNEVLTGSSGGRWPCAGGVNLAPGLTGRCLKKYSPTELAPR